jgi:hypothetical protein
MDENYFAVTERIIGRKMGWKFSGTPSTVVMGRNELVRIRILSISHRVFQNFDARKPREMCLIKLYLSASSADTRPRKNGSWFSDERMDFLPHSKSINPTVWWVDPESRLQNPMPPLVLLTGHFARFKHIYKTNKVIWCYEQSFVHLQAKSQTCLWKQKSKRRFCRRLMALKRGVYSRDITTMQIRWDVFARYQDSYSGVALE